MARITGRANWKQGIPRSLLSRRKSTTDEGEYGGMPGLIQPPPHAVGDVDSVGEAALIMRIEAKRMAGVDDTLPVTDLHYGSAKEIQDDLAVRLQGHRADELPPAERLD